MLFKGFIVSKLGGREYIHKNEMRIGVNGLFLVFVQLFICACVCCLLGFQEIYL